MGNMYSSEEHGSDIFLYCRKGYGIWHVMRGTYGGVCVKCRDNGDDMRFVGDMTFTDKKLAVKIAKEYAEFVGLTYKGVYDANEVDEDTVDVNGERTAKRTLRQPLLF